MILGTELKYARILDRSKNSSDIPISPTQQDETAGFLWRPTVDIEERDTLSPSGPLNSAQARVVNSRP